MNLLLLLAAQSFAAGHRALPPRLAPSSVAAMPGQRGAVHLSPIANEGPSETAVDELPYWEDFPGARVSGGSTQTKALTGPAEGPKWVEKPVLQAAFIAAPDVASLDELDGRWDAVEFGAPQFTPGPNGFGYIFHGGEYVRFDARANGETWQDKEVTHPVLERGAAVHRQPGGTRTIYLMGESRSEQFKTVPYTIAFRKEDAGSLLVEITVASDVTYYRLEKQP